MSRALQRAGFPAVSMDAEMNRAFGTLAKFMDSIMGRDTKGYMELMKGEPETAQEQQKPQTPNEKPVRKLKRGDDVKLSLKQSEITSERVSYDTLINKPDMKITQMETLDTGEIKKYTTESGNAFAQDMLGILERDNQSSRSVYVDDIGENILIGRNSYKHSGARRGAEYIQIAKNLKSILENAILVNEMTPRSETERKNVKGLNYTKVLIGIAEDSQTAYVVRFFADNRTQSNRENGTEYDYDILYSIAKDQIKNQGIAANADTAYGGKNHTGGTTPGTISIHDLLNLVKDAKNASAVISKDVADRLGIKRPYEKGVSEHLKFSVKDAAYREAVEKGDTAAQQKPKEPAVRKLKHGDDVKLSVKENTPSLRNQVREAGPQLDKMEPVANIKSDIDFEKYRKQGAISKEAQIKAWASEMMEKRGYKAHRDGFGDVSISKRRIAIGMKYLHTQYEIAALAAIPDVIEKGEHIHDHKNHKGRNVDSYTFAAPVKIDGEIGHMGVIVQWSDNENRYKTHTVLLPNGSVFTIEQKEKTGVANVTHGFNDEARTWRTSPVDDIKSHSDGDVKLGLKDRGQDSVEKRNDTGYNEANAEKGDQGNDRRRVERIRERVGDHVKSIPTWALIGRAAVSIGRGDYSGIIKRGQKGYELFEAALSDSEIKSKRGYPLIWYPREPAVRKLKRGDDVKLSVKQSTTTSDQVSYDTLIKKPDMKITQMEDVTEEEIKKYTADNDNAFAQDMLGILERANQGSRYVYVADVGENILIGRNSYKHSGARRGAVYIQITKNLKSILENAILVNEMTPRTETERKNVKGLNHTRVFLGIAVNNENAYVVRFFADNRTQHNRINEIEYDYDILYSIAKDEIKNPAKAADADTAYGGKNHTGGTSAGTITIMDLLNLVKRATNAETVISLDVAEHLGIKRPYEKGVTEHLRFSVKDSTAANQYSEMRPTDMQMPSDIGGIYKRQSEINAELRDVEKKIKEFNGSPEVRGLMSRMKNADASEMNSIL